MNNRFVYMILDSEKPGNFVYADYHLEYEPMYVGKGIHGRWKKHFEGAKRGDTRTHFRAKLKSCLDKNEIPSVKIIAENIDNVVACELETKLINIIGRRTLNTGPLYNVANGGEGGDRYTGNANRKRIIEKLKNRVPWNKGKTKESDDRVKSVSNTLKKLIQIGKYSMPSYCGRTHSEKSRMKMRESHLGIKLTIPRNDANEYTLYRDNVSIIKEKGRLRFSEKVKIKFPELSVNGMFRNKHKGFTLEITKSLQPR